MSQGWIKLHRKITDSYFWSDKPFSRGQAYIDLILKANHKCAEIYIRNQLIKVDRGQSARSEVSLSKDWGWSRQKVRCFLAQLEQNGKIEHLKTHLTSVITLCNYEEYQGGGDCEKTSKWTTDDTTERHRKDNGRYTNKNDKNENNEKNDKKTHTPPPRVEGDLWDEFLAIRKKTKAINSDRAITGIKNKLLKFSQQGYNPNDLVEQSVINSWKDIYEPKNKQPPPVRTANDRKLSTVEKFNRDGENWVREHWPDIL